MQLIAGSKSKGGALDCNHGGLREQEPAQPIAKGVQGEAGDGDAGAIKVVECLVGSASSRARGVRQTPRRRAERGPSGLSGTGVKHRKSDTKVEFRFFCVGELPVTPPVLNTFK